MTEQISIVKALQVFFSAAPHGRKIEIQEIKDLTFDDRAELRELLIAEGFDIAPLKAAA